MPKDLLAPGRLRVGVNLQDTIDDGGRFVAETTARGRVSFVAFLNSASAGSLSLWKARGTAAAPANVQDNDSLGALAFQSYSNGFTGAASVNAQVDGAVVAGQRPASRLVLMTNPNNTSPALKAYLSGDGKFAIGSAFDPSVAATRAAHPLHVVGSGAGVEHFITLENYDAAANASLRVGRARGTFAVPVTITNGDILGELEFFAYNAGTWYETSEVQGISDGAFLPGNTPPAALLLKVADIGGQITVMKLASDKKFIMGNSMTDFVDARFNFNLPSGVDTIAATFGQNGGAPNSFIIGFSTYSSGYTNGHPARIYIQDSSFSASMRFDLKLQNAASNAVSPALLLSPGTAMPNAAFFSAAGSYGNGQGVVFIGNRNAAPSANPVGGGLLYAEGGALKWRGSAGTVTNIANA